MNLEILNHFKNYSIENINKYDLRYQKALNFAAWFVVIILVLMFFSMFAKSWLAIKSLGLKFLFNVDWNPAFDEYGAITFIIGTLLTSFLALLISMPFALAIALFLGEYYRTGAISSFLKSSIELLAGIPSVIYGFWGLFVLVPIIRNIELALGLTPFGVGIFTAALVLAVMITPYTASLAREVIQLVPKDLKEAAYSLGATRFEVIKTVVIPYARSGILAGILLALGRALGETMAVTMVIGNANIIPTSIFSPGNTIASIIANDFGEAAKNLYVSSIIELGLIIFLITLAINYAGKYIMKKMSVEKNSKNG
ncbi:MAG: phosphate ABC transporter permease subunit PstC [Candidatus Margulisbacteria bacterium]|nr:phosphate ABC transporter permease subunit PstC [Candidatus Margulisiibacteriota bacterium]